MFEFDSTTRVKIAGAIVLTASLCAAGCGSSPRTQFLQNRSIVHVSRAGSGDRLPINPVLAQSKGLDIVRR